MSKYIKTTEGVRQNVIGVARPGTARASSTTTTSQRITLTATCRLVSLRQQTSDARYEIGTADALPTATSSSHSLGTNERIDIEVPPNCVIAVLRDSAASADGVFNVTELV